MKTRKDTPQARCIRMVLVDGRMASKSKIVDQARNRSLDYPLRPHGNGLPKYDEGIRVCEGRGGKRYSSLRKGEARLHFQGRQDAAR